MSIIAVIGTQFGDEGKGKFVDYLAQDADLVIRVQGGDNAGHTVVNEKGTFKLHLVPSGIFNESVVCLLGGGMAINLTSLDDEIKMLNDRGVSTQHLYISDRAHLVYPRHVLVDAVEEASRGNNKIGTTLKGIGPAYVDKYARKGIRAGDLLDSDRPDMTVLENHWHDLFWDRVIDTLPVIQHHILNDKNIILEGQLGTMRDIDWGIYPYVTSSSTLAAYAAASAGIPPRLITDVIGVAKAYTTCVGAGPFVGELFDEDGEKLREIGGEYGTTTGRPRRVAWFDSVVVNYACMLNGVTKLVLSKLDVLDSFPEVRLCVAYELPNGDVTQKMLDTKTLETATPVYEVWPGWLEPTTRVRRWVDLPNKARLFIQRIIDLTEVHLSHISIGADRDSTIQL